MQKLRLILIMIQFLAVGCQRFDLAGEALATYFANEQCKIAQLSKNPLSKTQNQVNYFSPHSSSKLAFDSEVLTQRSNSLALSKASPEEIKLSVGFELVVSLDANCVLDSNYGSDDNDFVLTQNAPKGVFKNGMSGPTSVTIPLWREFSVSELDDMAESDKCVLAVSQELKVEAFDIDFSFDTGTDVQRHLSAIDAFNGWNKFYDNSTGLSGEVVIAIIDSGVDISHEDLVNNIWVNTAESANPNGQDTDGNGYIDDRNGYNFVEDSGTRLLSPGGGKSFHGTHVAGLAAASLGNGRGGAGIVGRNAKIMVLNVFGDRDEGSISAIDRAIRYAADNGAHVINLSVGASGRSATTEEAIRYAISKSVTIIAASGNDGIDITNKFITPVSYAKDIAGLISVGSSSASTQSITLYSNASQEYVEIAAPGSHDFEGNEGLLSTFPGNQYSQVSGTSMSAPVVSGAAALAVAMWGTTTARVGPDGGKVPSPSTVESLLLDSADKDLYGCFGLGQYIKDGNHLNISNLYDLVLTRASK